MHAQMLRPGQPQVLVFKSYPPCGQRQHLSLGTRARPLGLVFYVSGGHWTQVLVCAQVSPQPQNYYFLQGIYFYHIKKYSWHITYTLSSNVYPQLFISKIEFYWNCKGQLENYINDSINRFLLCFSPLLKLTNLQNSQWHHFSNSQSFSL